MASLTGQALGWRPRPLPAGWLGLVAVVVATGLSVAEEDSPVRCAHDPVARVSRTAHRDSGGWRGSLGTKSRGRGATQQAWERLAASRPCRCVGIPSSHHVEWTFIPACHLRHRAHVPPASSSHNLWGPARDPNPQQETRPGQDAPVKSSGGQGHAVQEGETERKTGWFGSHAASPLARGHSRCHLSACSHPVGAERPPALPGDSPKSSGATAWIGFLHNGAGRQPGSLSHCP